MNIVTGRFGPREIALGIAFGILLGLLPKDNLLFIVTAILFFLSHSNLVVGIVIAAVTTWTALWIAPFTDVIGRQILNAPIGQQIIGGLFQFPLLPWTMLDNTLVLGSFILGFILFLPLFVIVWFPLKILMLKKEENKKEKNKQA